jgi:hypothetical protein
MIDLCELLRAELAANGARGNRFGTTSEDVFNLAQLMSAISASFSKSDVKEIQKTFNIHTKVWSKFLLVLNDSRLKVLRESNYNLPSSYSALYALSVMDDEEFESYLKETSIDETTSTRAILGWTQNFRALSYQLA